MALLGMQDVSIAFGGPPVLDHARFAIERGERVCLLGRNGAGKSTIMKLLDGSLRADSGEIVRQTGMTVARLEQEIPEDVEGSTFDVVSAGLGDAGRLLARYHHASHRVSVEHGSAASLKEMDRLHQALDTANAWEVQTRVDTVLLHLALDADAPFQSLSGGRKRQALLARALVGEPDLLLLDEPTNHLDIEAVEWMESFLVERATTLLFVTHDRAFLRRLATRIVELDRGRLIDWGTGYDLYLDRKEAALAVEAKEWSEFDRKLAKEEVWIRTGIQARRTRNEGRVRSLEALRVERGTRRERIGTVRLQAQEGERSGRLVVEARAVSFARGDRPIVSDLTTTITRGDRVGLIGPNGSGKTTLLRLLLGELAPDSGSIRLGTGLELAYFDQLREQLDPDRSVFDSVADGADFVETVNGQQHVHGYLEKFLFPPDRARTPVRALSGGERNRLLLARLFTRTFNLLVLDEPTNSTSRRSTSSKRCCWSSRAPSSSSATTAPFSTTSSRALSCSRVAAEWESMSGDIPIGYGSGRTSRRRPSRHPPSRSGTPIRRRRSAMRPEPSHASCRSGRVPSSPRSPIVSTRSSRSVPGSMCRSPIPCCCATRPPSRPLGRVSRRWSRRVRRRSCGGRSSKRLRRRASYFSASSPRSNTIVTR
jgi:ATP-binding cassette subfamily F protein uup